MKPTLLILSDWYVPAVKAGGPVRSVYAIAQALKDEFAVRVFTSNEDVGSQEPLPGVLSDQWVLHDGVEVYYASKKERKRRLQEVLREANGRIYMNSLFSVDFTLYPLYYLGLLGKKHNVLLAPRGMLGAGALKLKATKKKWFLRVAKWLGLFKGIQWHASTPIEQDEIQKVFPSADVISLRNLSSIEKLPFRVLEKVSGELSMVFLSRISEKKNLRFLLEVLQELKNPMVTLSIYGPIEDEDYWESCRTLLTDKVTYKGTLQPEELGKVLTSYHLFVLPTMHENFGHVIVEALNASVPVMLSPNTPWRAIDEKKAGVTTSLSPDSWKNTMLTFAEMTSEAYMEWRKGAWEHGQEALDQKALMAQYKKVFSV